MNRLHLRQQHVYHLRYLLHFRESAGDAYWLVWVSSFNFVEHGLYSALVVRDINIDYLAAFIYDQLFHSAGLIRLTDLIQGLV